MAVIARKPKADEAISVTDTALFTKLVSSRQDIQGALELKVPPVPAGG